MKYSYFPGCSLEATARSYEVSTKAVCKALGIELEELDDWSCCGATAFYSIDELLALSLAADSDGSIILTSSAIMAMTTSSSISVKPCGFRPKRLGFRISCKKKGSVFMMRP